MAPAQIFKKIIRYLVSFGLIIIQISFYYNWKHIITIETISITNSKMALFGNLQSYEKYLS